ncbi:uncharacterized protein LOC114459396 [Gouania willdenowi]|uniref:uncharacterized protein LOC114459396 n=1 Tax=Gouania willdenowi TaxID=441366 RepID=UPI001055424C|nr:uncharacterized protein LOC114459396 [Gouania willdenowi]
MPRTKSHRRSEAAKRRMAEKLAPLVTLAPRTDPDDARIGVGTGKRHAVKKWEVSSLTGHQHKLTIPAESPDKKFVLLVGDSHLRSIADGIVKMPEGRLSFGVMSTPGGSANDERIELLNSTLPYDPDLVCLLAPTNNLKSTRNPEKAGADFARLLSSILTRWSRLVVVDFPPRLDADLYPQEMMRQEFHRVAVKLGVKFVPIAEHFPVGNTALWARDGVHLSDNEGMPILAQLLWRTSYLELETVPVSKPALAPVRTPPVPRHRPRVVLKGEVVSPPPQKNPFIWSAIGQGRKRNTSGEDSSSVFPTKGMDKQQVVSEFSIPLSPVWFSPAMLDLMDRLVPSDLSSPESISSPSQLKCPRGKGKKPRAVKVKSQSSPSRFLHGGVEREPQVVTGCVGLSPSVAVARTPAQEQFATLCVCLKAVHKTHGCVKC